MRRLLDGRFQRFLKRLYGSELFAQLATKWPTRPLYWRLAERYYRRRRPFDVDDYQVPIDPFRIAWVDPDRIVRMTGRRFTWKNVCDNFGTVRGGDWDERPPPDLPRGHSARQNWYLQVAPCFEENIHHQSLAAHFRDGVPWEETEFVRKMRWILEHESGWHCETIDQLEERCASLDRLYEDIKQNGYRTQQQLVKEGTQEWRGFLGLVRNEILVDVGRDGELLFVDSRHRLSIAKILGLDEVPVAVQLRHPEWMSHLEEVYWSETDSSHPDLTE